jgi:hypothetical protein
MIQFRAFGIAVMGIFMAWNGLNFLRPYGPALALPLIFGGLFLMVYGLIVIFRAPPVE